MHRSTFAVLLLSMVGVTGCGGGASVVAVEGVVTLDGRPLPNANVALLPLTAAGAGPFSGTTDAAGKFTLRSQDGPGAVPAEYYVNITTVQPGDGIEGAPAAAQKEVVPIAYQNSSTKYTVPPEGTSSANFDLKSR